jgi:hypothetical protein
MPLSIDNCVSSSLSLCLSLCVCRQIYQFVVHMFLHIYHWNTSWYKIKCNWLIHPLLLHSMILLKTQMFSYIGLVELLGWVNKGMLWSSYYQRCCHKYHVVVPFDNLHKILQIYIFNGKLIYVNVQEESYVEFLRIRGVPLQERTCSDNAPDVVPEVCSRPLLSWFLVLSCFMDAIGGWGSFPLLWLSMDSNNSFQICELLNIVLVESTWK